MEQCSEDGSSHSVLVTAVAMNCLSIVSGQLCDRGVCKPPVFTDQLRDHKISAASDSMPPDEPSQSVCVSCHVLNWSVCLPP